MNRAQRRQKLKGSKMNVDKDYLKEAQDNLKKVICKKTEKYECVESLTRSLINIAEYIKITRELNEENEY